MELNRNENTQLPRITKITPAMAFAQNRCAQKVPKELDRAMRGLEDFQTQNYDQNRARAEEKGLEFCVCCGKAMSNPKYYVHTAYGGMVYKADNAIFMDCWDQPIGTECLKKYPHGYVLEYVD